MRNTQYWKLTFEEEQSILELMQVGVISDKNHLLSLTIRNRLQFCVLNTIMFQSPYSLLYFVILMSG